jgi:hypothetical protein
MLGSVCGRPVGKISAAAGLGLFQSSYCPGFRLKRLGKSTAMSARTGIKITQTDLSFLPMFVKINSLETQPQKDTEIQEFNGSDAYIKPPQPPLSRGPVGRQGPPKIQNPQSQFRLDSVLLTDGSILYPS